MLTYFLICGSSYLVLTYQAERVEDESPPYIPRSSCSPCHTLYPNHVDSLSLSCDSNFAVPSSCAVGTVLRGTWTLSDIDQPSLHLAMDPLQGATTPGGFS